VQEVDEGLIYDVGMHIATDSAYYLRRGFRVVAVEANPMLVEDARRRFASEIAAGRLTVVGVGIAEHPGEATFWVCDDWTAWSSFDREVASRNGNRHHAVAVEQRPLLDIFTQYGMPYYCKVDIEGHDRYCLDGLRPDFRPRFVSVELSEYPFFERLREVGFDRFKLVHQLSFSPPSARWHAVRSLAVGARLQAGLERARGFARGALLHDGWYFRIGSSGPLPFKSPGGWMDYEDAVALHAYMLRQFAAGRFGLLDSFDLHATDAETLAGLRGNGDRGPYAGPQPGDQRAGF
jgi:FkbM family methyltransferase